MVERDYNRTATKEEEKDSNEDALTGADRQR